MYMPTTGSIDLVGRPTAPTGPM